MELNNENYFTTQANIDYLSCSQFKDFMKCEKEALAKVFGEIEEKKTDALLFGGYVDAYFSNELEQFKLDNPDMFNTRTGELKAPFKNVEDVIKAIESDELLMQYLNGKKQVVMTGEIAGVPFKIKVDALHEDKIVDQKIIKDLDLTWVERNGRNVKTDFIDSYGYDIQGAIYQSIVEQNTGKKLPFILAITTKEENPDKALIQIDQKYLDKALELVKELAPRYAKIKKGLILPNGCNHCPTCRKDKVLTSVVMYSDFFNKVEEDETE